jgi:hypothetical protein
LSGWEAQRRASNAAHSPPPCFVDATRLLHLLHLTRSLHRRQHSLYQRHRTHAITFSAFSTLHHPSLPLISLNSSHRPRPSLSLRQPFQLFSSYSLARSQHWHTLPSPSPRLFLPSLPSALASLFGPLRLRQQLSPSSSTPLNSSAALSRIGARVGDFSHEGEPGESFLDVFHR